METGDLHERKPSINGKEKSPEETELQNDGEKQKYEMTGTLQTNTFSLIYITEVNSNAFRISIFFAIFQLVMLCLVLTGQINPYTTKDPLDVPNNVSTVVRTAGFMSLTFSVAYFWDLMDAVEKLLQTPPIPDEQCPGATRW